MFFSIFRYRTSSFFNYKKITILNLLNVNKILFCLGLSIICFFSSCKKDQPEGPNLNANTFIFLGHTYDWNDLAGTTVDPRIEQLPLSDYKGIMLGGDICAAVTRRQETIYHIDYLFDLKDHLTFYTLGNHDTSHGNLHYITDATQRPDFYTYYHDETLFMVLNCSYDYVDSLKNKCDRMQAQLDMIQQTLDTLTAPNLFILTHQVIWGICEPDMRSTENANAEVGYYRFLCNGGFSTRFDVAIYPYLKTLRSQGTDVFVVSGDGGQRSKKYHYESPDGINFFISGINNSLKPENTPLSLIDDINFNPDSVLLFHQDEFDHSFEWEFVELNGLVE